MPLIENLIHNEAHALGEAAAGILAQLAAAGLHSPTPVVAPPAVYQFTITLAEITPPIWRRFLISNQVTLRRLHNLIQIVCGWRNCHLHRFEIAGTEYGRPDPLEDMHLVGDTRVTLAKLPLTPGTRFRYEYDFGDSWEHELLLEEVLPAEDAPVHPVCLGGERGFPLEDSGGVDGYYDTLRALRMPDHPDHRSLCAWAGPGYDPEGFDLEAVNRRLRNAGEAGHEARHGLCHRATAGHEAAARSGRRRPARPAPRRSPRGPGSTSPSG